MNKALIALAVLLAFGFGGFVLMHNNQTAMQYGDDSNTPVATDDTQSTSGTEATSSPGTTYTAADVATHTDASSCWTIIDGDVYDLTKAISKHPGGPQAILGLCGKDGTQAFRNQHDHNPRQENALANYKIGTLVQ